MPLLSEAERTSALDGLSGWSYDAGRNGIAKSFKFADFVTRVALAAEKADHHPDWSNVWNRVDVLLNTHSEGGVTERDMALARAMDAIAG